MGLWDKILDKAGYAKKTDTPTTTAPPPPAVKEPTLPVGGGRSSVDSSVTMTGILGSYESKPEFPLEFLRGLKMLAMYNADFSYAVDNIKQLAATDFKIYLPDTMPDELKTKFTAEITAQWANWYPGGRTSLVADLTVQLAINGALSLEAVPNRFLDGLDKIVLVDVDSIRFKHDQKTDTHKPYQKVNNIFTPTAEGLVPLNTTTYKYQALTRFSSSPYGVPPLLSSLESMATDKDMMVNFKTIMKKAGWLGFLDVLVQQPSQGPEESDAAYEARMFKYLREMGSQVQESLGSGFAIGFKDAHEFKMQPSAADATGSQKILEINDTRKMAGLKQDPLMLGRNQSTTEALARVIITKLANQAVSHQHPVEEVLAYYVALYGYLRGYRIDGPIKVELDKSLLADKLKDAQAEELEILNADSLYKQGVISQQQRAQRLGYEKPNQEEPRQTVGASALSPQEKQAGATASQPSNKGVKVSASFTYLGGQVTEFAYGEAPTSRDNYFFNRYVMGYRADGSTDLLAEKIVEYYNATADNYHRAADDVTVLIAKEIGQLAETATLQEFTDTVISTLYQNWGTVFVASQRNIVSELVTAAYKAFRQDTSPFGNGEVPEATFTLLDERAISYYKSSDSLYLGKFVTDNDTKKKITAFLKEQYLGENTPIGKNKAAISEFKKLFPDVLAQEDWKIARIINTTVNKMRNNAAIVYMNQAGVTTYEVIEANDKLTCDWCKSMHGRKFSVKESYSQLEGLYSSSPAEVGSVSPFINSVYKNASELQGVSNATLQAKGISIPAYHSNCRGTIAAVFESQ